MKTLQSRIGHRHLEELMGRRCIGRWFGSEDLGHLRDHCVVTAQVRQEHLDEVVGKRANHPRRVRWP